LTAEIFWVTVDSCRRLVSTIRENRKERNPVNRSKGASDLDSTSAEAFRRATVGSEESPGGGAATPARAVTGLRFADGAISFVHPLPVDALVAGPRPEGDR
jgi:hypothetical protein